MTEKILESRKNGMMVLLLTLAGYVLAVLGIVLGTSFYIAWFVNVLLLVVCMAFRGLALHYNDKSQ